MDSNSDNTPTTATPHGRSSKEFMWYDYFIFILTLFIALGIGIWSALAGDKQRSTSSYLLGSRSLKPFPVSLSIFMSYVSAILVLGNPAEVYFHGIQTWFFVVGSSIAYCLSALIFVRLFFPLRITSAFEYLEMRFRSRAVKLTGTIFLMIFQVMYMGLAMYSPATALDSVTPIPTWAAILATGVVCTVYTSIGGIKAVVWTDVFQGFILFGGLLAVTVVGVFKVGGFERVLDIASKGGRMDLDFSLDPTVRLTVWSCIFGRTFATLKSSGTGQSSVQRYCALRTKKEAVMSVLLNIPLLLIVYSLASFVGLTIFAYYWDLGCDPLRSGEIDNANQLLPHFIVDVLRAPGLTGLFVAVLFSGALSSVSSSMNSLSAVTWKDMMEWKFYYLPEWKKALITKLLAAGYGIIGIFFAFFFGITPGNVLQISSSFVSGVAGPLLGMFMLGSLFPFANKWGALFGGWFGLAFNVMALMGRSFSKPHISYLDTTVHNCYNGTAIKPIPEDPEGVFMLFKLSFILFSALGALTTIVVGLIVSWATGFDKPSEHDPLLIVPIFDILGFFLPNKWLKYLRCGVRHDEVELDDNGHAIKYLDNMKCNTKENELELESLTEKMKTMKT